MVVTLAAYRSLAGALSFLGYTEPSEIRARVLDAWEMAAIYSSNCRIGPASTGVVRELSWWS
ncbi:MAG: hypothetical protein ACYDEY_00335 [Acidimicrobiales bacterium]